MSAHLKIAAIDARIAELQAKRAELVIAAENEIDTSLIVKGAVVTFEFGRGENKTTKTGTVMGVRREEGKAPIAKVLIEEENGNADLVGIFLSAVKSIGGAEKADPLATSDSLLGADGLPV